MCEKNIYLDLDLVRETEECPSSTSITSSLSLEFWFTCIWRRFCTVCVAAAQIDVDADAITNVTESLLSLLSLSLFKFDETVSRAEDGTLSFTFASFASELSSALLAMHEKK